MATLCIGVILSALAIFSAVNIKKAWFITSDGISITLNVRELYEDCSETYITSSVWIIKKNCFQPTRVVPKNLLVLLLLAAGDVETQPGPSSLHSFTRKRGFKILHQNINGMRSKMDSVKILLDKKNIHLFGFTESHADASVTDSELSVDGYRVERKDRETGSHGGVLCFTRNDVKYERRRDLEMKGIEAIWLEVCFIKTKPILICFLYRPPDSSRHLDKNFLTKFENVIEMMDLENKEAILAVDLNCDYLLKNDRKEIKDVLSRYKLTQLIKHPTRITKHSKSLIDIMCTNNKITVYDTIIEPSAISDHDIIGLNRKVHCQKFTPRRIFTRDFSKYDEQGFRREICSKNWKVLLSNVDFNAAWNVFKHELQKIVNKHAPTKEKMVRGKPSPWLTLEIKNAMNERDYYLKTARRTNAESDWLSYRRARNFVTHAIRQSKAHYCRNLLHETSHQPGDFWKNIKKFYPIKQKSTELPSMMKIHGERTYDKTTIANSFCNFFSTVGSKLQNQVLPLCNSAWKIYTNKRLQNMMCSPATLRF